MDGYHVMQQGSYRYWAKLGSRDSFIYLSAWSTWRKLTRQDFVHYSKLFSSKTLRSKRQNPQNQPTEALTKLWLMFSCMNFQQWAQRNVLSSPEKVAGENSNLTMEECNVEAASKENTCLNMKFFFFSSLSLLFCCLFNPKTQGLHFQELAIGNPLNKNKCSNTWSGCLKHTLNTS